MLDEMVNFLKERGIGQAKIALVLGSGLGEIVDDFVNAVKIPYETIPDFPRSTVEGHAGQLVFGYLAGQPVIALQGRFHYYEGYDLKKVTLPIRLFKALGIEHLVVTNAAGGVNTSFKPGDLMVIKDHINLTGQNPLIGMNLEGGPRFVDMSQAYDSQGSQLLFEVAEDFGLYLQEGVYTWMTGPSYETPAEIRAIRTMGGDAVGMSTVPEVIVAKHQAMKVVGISCITNYASGMQSRLDHEEVMAVSSRVKPQFKALLTKFVERFSDWAQ